MVILVLMQLLKKDIFSNLAIEIFGHKNAIWNCRK
jgi:hypothetical protein